MNENEQQIEWLHYLLRYAKNVERMRWEQKEYLRTKDRFALLTAKKYEQAIDEMNYQFIHKLDEYLKNYR